MGVRRGKLYSMKRYKYWDLKHYDREEIKTLAAKIGISPVTAGILWNRGLREENGIREFLFGKKDTYYDPFLMKDMRLAAERILCTATMTWTASQPVHYCIYI